MKNRLLLYTVVIVLIFSLVSCVKPSGIPPTSQLPGSTEANTSAAIQGNALAISSTNAFIDSFGTYHVVGEVINNSNQVVSSIELTVEIKDGSGNSLLKDDSGNLTANVKISPLLYTLVPGNSSPFEYSYETTQGAPASYTVIISGQQTGTASPAPLNTENVQLVDDGSGWFYLTGEVVNTGNQWAHVNSMAGAVKDDGGKVLSADWTANYATELAPAGDGSGRDRSPFEINFPNPGNATKWQVYLDADTSNSVIDYPMGVNVTNTYFDQYGSFHVVGLAKNNSDKALDSLVVAGVYGADKTVLDSSYVFVPLPINPGGEAPFSLSSFSSINSIPNQASMVSTTTVQADPWFTSPPTNEYVDLATSNETIEKPDGTWTFTGDVTNTSGKSLSSITVVVEVKDAQGKLVAMEYTSISPSTDAIAVDETNPYSVKLYLDPAADTSGFTTSTVVIGDVK